MLALTSSIGCSARCERSVGDQCLQNANSSVPVSTTPPPMATKAKIGIAAGLVGVLALGAGSATYAIKHQRWPL
jgi:hypothetical protein